MKIAIVTGAFPTLSETFVLNQITGLIDRGHEVDIIAIHNPNEEKIHNDYFKYELEKRVGYIDMPKNKLSRVIYAPKIIARNLLKGNVKVLRALNILSYGKEAISLRPLYWLCPFLNHDYDVILCHFGTIGRSIAMIKDLNNQPKVITVFHGYDMSASLLHNEKYYNSLFENGDLFLPISNFWKKRLCELNCREDKIIVHHMGINLDRFQFKQRVKHADQPTTVLTVGRLVEKKGYEYAIRAVGKLLENNYNIRYWIVGDGPLKPNLEMLIRDLGIKNHVTLIGGLEQDSLIKIYDESHIFLLASVTSIRGDMEGIPVVLMEAQAMGLPVVSTFHSGIPEVVKNGESGILVPERNIDELAKAIEYFHENPHAWATFGKNGRKHIEKNFEINRLNENLLHYFKLCTDGSKRK